jgi:hypothetical protein
MHRKEAKAVLALAEEVDLVQNLSAFLSVITI